MMPLMKMISVPGHTVHRGVPQEPHKRNAALQNHKPTPVLPPCKSIIERYSDLAFLIQSVSHDHLNQLDLQLV